MDAPAASSECQTKEGIIEVIASAMRCLSDESLDPEERFDLAEYMISKLPQATFPTFHKFGDGVYVREVSYPAGTVITGVTYLKEFPIFFLKGEVAIYWLEGRKTMQNVFHAPAYTMTKPGTRRFGFVLSDTTMAYAVPTDKTTPDDVLTDPGFISQRVNPLLDPGFIPEWRRANQQQERLS